MARCSVKKAHGELHLLPLCATIVGYVYLGAVYSHNEIGRFSTDITKVWGR